jgi:Retrotransposon gag protein
MSDGQQASLTQHLLNSNSALNKKVDKLAEALETLTIGDDLKEYIGKQLTGIKTEGIRNEFKIKDLDTYDGEKQKLRSWLTAANLQIVNKGIEGEERKVRFIGSYLRGRAWQWFEPILRESDEKPRKEWSDRATRILNSYKEMKKAMGQVFGEIDERKTAAERLQRLRQTRSVTDYITDFQMITSNLDWDEDALEDKFLEGLKPEIRRALIYYPTEPENLEEVFERAQRIDREIWGQRHYSGEYGNQRRQPRARFFEKRETFRTDRDGDIKMKGAKVNMDKARRERLCFNCELPGHQARNCRKKQSNKDNKGQKHATVRMMRSGNAKTVDQKNHESSEDQGEAIWTPTGLTQELEGLSLKDLETNSTSSEATKEKEDPNERIHEWRKSIPSTTRGRVQGYRGRRRPLNTAAELRKLTQSTGKQPDEKPEHQGIQVKANVLEVEQESSKDLDTARDSTTNYRPKEVEGSEATINERLARVEFEELNRTNRPSWREFCKIRGDDQEENEAEQERETNKCKCFNFDQHCWADSGERWINHIRRCKECERWTDTRCDLEGHSPKSKTSVLADLGNRRFIADGPLRDNLGRTCCEKALCTHEFFRHQRYDIPWWACIERDCDRHEPMKIRNGIWPRLPRSTILKAQRCPCFRKGCLCNFDSRHPFYEELLFPPANERVKDELDTMVEGLKRRNAYEMERLKKEITRVRMADTSDNKAKQIEIRVKVGNEDVTAIIDCGADIDYINQEWCEERNFKQRTVGEGWIEGFDGERKKTKVRDAEVKFRFNGVFQRNKFRVLEKTGEDKMVLGMPWLQKENPVIDWKARTVNLRNASKVQGREVRTPVPRIDDPEKDDEKPAYGKNPDERRVRGGYGGDQAQPRKTSEEFRKELETIKEKLPEQVKDFADIFCQSE